MADTIKTRDQLIQRAAVNLGLLQPGEELAAEDKDTLNNLVDPLMAQLAADDIIYVDDPNAIDLGIFMPLAAVLANYAGPSFGAPINDDALIRDQNTLRRISVSKPTYAPMKSVYY